MKYKNYVFDMGKVFVDYDGHIACEKYIKNPNNIPFVFDKVFHSLEMAYLDAGIISVKQGWDSIASGIEDKKLREEAKKVFYNWPKVALMPVWEMEDVVKTLKSRGAKVYILSNVNALIKPYMKKVLPGYKLFDGIFLSFDSGYMKPQKDIYESFLKKYKLKAKDSVFIDDIKWNVDAAKKVGMAGYQHKNLDIKKLKKFLGI